MGQKWADVLGVLAGVAGWLALWWFLPVVLLVPWQVLTTAGP